ncbi:MAG TPA: chemotaxis protein CheB [Anaerolineales bacterium]|nr:chemotaxis protein CheB [Anaerolineales bacterium]
MEAKAPGKPANTERGLTVVGIGASAGGLKALQSFFEALPAEPGMAFVVITHLHPEHESHLAELLQKHTRMPTMQVRKRTKVEANHVYVIPPNRRMIMTDTHLDTHEFEEPHGRRMPIDHFFRSVAASGHTDPVAIILSGGGTDGAVGIKAVKEVGGMIMVQQPEDAEYDGMPRAALSTGLVDIVLPAALLAEKLSDLIQHQPRLPHDAGHLTEADVETLQRILAQVHARTGHDFSQYKRSTILRRVDRRMQLNGFGKLDAYLAYLRSSPNEAQTMFNDILIGVTNFFRDRDAWLVLEQEVIPNLVRQNGVMEGEGLRIWTIGCATGEEAYGLAILCFEEADRQGVRPRVQVFASDLDERSVAHAREGIYPAAIEADVSRERLEKFFTREGDYYRVRRELRDAVLFTNHNVMRDPPFSRQHLIACRNVLIYLQRAVQDQIFDIFHYSLNPGGYLFLGSAESAEHLPEFFKVVDKKHRLYQANALAGERAGIPALPSNMRRVPRGGRKAEGFSKTRLQGARFLEEPIVMQEQHHRALESSSPPSVIVDEKYTILHVSDHAGRYLHQPRGILTGDLLTLVRPELQMELRTALFQSFEKWKATVTRSVPVRFNGHKRRVVVSVRPRLDETTLNGSVVRQALVLFIEDEVEDPDESLKESLTPGSPSERDQLLAELQADNQRLREQLQITTEEYQSSNEEMKAANEELQSINEEYRSATEELETSKEELQSVNEELQTVNSEMKGKLDEISRAHQELENLMGATEIATLYLDRELRIQRYTAGVEELFSILYVDRGRHISDLTHTLGYSEFLEDAEQVLRRLVPLEREVQTAAGRWYLMRLRPYRTRDDRIEGVVISFIDINQLKETERELVLAKESLEERVQERTRELDEASQKLRQARDLFYALFNANPIPTVLTRLEDGIFLNVNVEFLNYFGLQPEDVIGRSPEEFNLGLGLGTAEYDSFVAQIKRDGRVRSYETQIRQPPGEWRNILASVQYIELDEAEAMISTFIDITDRVRAEQQIRSLAAELTATEQAERHQLSQILHDDLQQRIYAVQMQMSFLREAYEKNNLQAFAANFPQMEAWLTEAIRGTRQLSVDLSPPILHGEGLVEATIWLAAQMEEQYGLKVDIQSSGVPRELDEKLRVLVFYALRELLFNIVKHAGTLEASVDFDHRDSQLLATVRDQGAGFDSRAVIDNPRISHGLIMIRHRLSLLGCSMQVHSQPGQGTEVVIEVPYEKKDA